MSSIVIDYFRFLEEMIILQYFPLYSDIHTLKGKFFHNKKFENIVILCKDESIFQHDENLFDTVMHGIHMRLFRQTFRDHRIC